MGRKVVSGAFATLLLSGFATVNAVVIWGPTKDVLVQDGDNVVENEFSELGWDAGDGNDFSYNSLSVSGGFLEVERIYAGSVQDHVITISGGHLKDRGGVTIFGYNVNTTVNQSGGILESTGLAALGRNGETTVFNMSGGQWLIGSDPPGASGNLFMPGNDPGCCDGYGTPGVLNFSGGEIVIMAEDWSATGFDILGQSWFNDQSGGASVTWDGAKTMILGSKMVVNHSEGSTLVKEENQTSDAFTVELMEEPNAEVTVTVDPATADLILNDNSEPNDPVTLVFTTGNWDTPQSVTVMAFDDALPEGTQIATITLSATSSDGNYDQDTGHVSVTVFDNDSAVVIIEETDGSTNVVESGLTDSYEVALGFAPTSEVTITIDDNGDPNQVTVDGGETTTLTFTTSDWDTLQTVTVEAIDDDVPEAAPHNTTLTHSVSQPGGDNAYDGLSVINVSVSVGENDCGFAPIDDTDFTGGPEGQPDCITDLLDFAHFVANYLNCSINICP